MNEISKKLSHLFLSKEVKQSWESVKDMSIQGYNSSFIYDFLLRDAMYHVGELWQKNTITVADEHLATGTCDMILSKYHSEIMFNKLPETKLSAPRAMLFCVEGEEHYLGLKMASSLFEEFGWDVYNLGSNLPLDYAEYSLQKWKPEVVCISISIRHYLPKLKETLDRLHAIRPETTFIVGSRLHGEAAFLSCCTPDTIIAKDATFLYEWLHTHQEEAGTVNKGVLM